MTDADLNRRLAQALGRTFLVPRYSTSPDVVFASWGLLDQMRERGYYLALMMEFAHCQPPRWSACFEEFVSGREWQEYGTTPMEAVTRAALAALTTPERGTLNSGGQP